MLPLTDPEIRASLVNVSMRERKGLTLPTNFAALPWDSLDFLGWRDPKIPGIGYVITALDDAPVGILLTQAKGRMQTRPQCSWCTDVQLPNEVVLFSAKRAGAAGRNGDTVATLACANFECCANVRKLPSMAYIGFDVEAARRDRIASLGEHVGNFVQDVRDGN
ncbi:FBP domain-containing protein [Cryobacterium melibiosiphilum]|uniref:FBP domain-containing protein n=1 Tax=Cryobacterium melibiosiphilum TaxID=995039 RepID=A0A3A5MI78_9MICO|nr:FBP domain-containing protein [Cryobacterium melibiosiphilum]RJT85617.1 FBP domain-containing protein [Cryobacterium melibiosiphilum]